MSRIVRMQPAACHDCPAERRVAPCDPLGDPAVANLTITTHSRDSQNSRDSRSSRGSQDGQRMSAGPEMAGVLTSLICFQR